VAREQIESVDGRLVEPVAGEHEQEARDHRLDEMDARRFERLEKSAGESDGDDVLLPDFLAPSGLETKRPRIGLRGAIETREQLRRGFIVRQVFAAICVAVAGAMLQRDAPLP